MATRGTITCAYCSNPIPAGVSTCPTCSAPAPPRPEHDQAPAPPPQQVVIGPGVPHPVSSPQRWPGQPRPPGSGFGGPPQSFAPPPVQVFYNPPAQPKRRGCVVALAALIALAGVGVAIFMNAARSPGGASVASGVPEPIQLNQVLAGELTTFTTRRLYQLTVTEPTQVMISATSTWDNYLEVHMGPDASGMLLYQDDDSGGSRNALINALLAPGVYTIVVRPFSRATGAFTLNVTGYSAMPRPPPGPYGYPGGPDPSAIAPQLYPQLPVQ